MPMDHPSRPTSPASSSRPSLAEHQQRHQRDEVRSALRALLMTPLMAPDHAHFAAVRRQAETLREWFGRETGWVLQVERDGARLYKRPAGVVSTSASNSASPAASPAVSPTVSPAADATRGLPGYDRRRYTLLCLACAVLDRADAQITLRLLGERLLLLAAEPVLAARGFSFALVAQQERRELVAVCRTLLGLGVLQRVAGDEDGFLQASHDPSGQAQGDALYDIQRRALAGLLAAVRGPSTWAADDMPSTHAARLSAISTEHVADSDDARRTALRHRLARQLLDDPVVYAEALDPEARAYFMNQRGTLATRLCEATGLLPEQRAEGLALVDADGDLSDLALPAEGTDPHVALLVAQDLAALCRATPSGSAAPTVRQHDIADLLRRARNSQGRYWRKSAREPGAERDLAEGAVNRLAQLQLLVRDGDSVRPLPGIARFAQTGGTGAAPAPVPTATATGKPTNSRPGARPDKPTSGGTGSLFDLD